MEILQLYNVSKNFGKSEVLKNVSFSVKTGEILGIFGRNGSGKSTLLTILFGTLSASSGKITINDAEVSSSEVIKKQLIAYAPQHPFIPKNLKVRDSIPIYFNDEKKQDAIFYNPVIANITHKKIGELSHGERKFFESILISQLPHPFLLFDEPFSMLEPLQIKKLKAFFKKISSKKGIIITDHYYRDILDISTKNILLKDGNSITIENADDLKSNEYLINN